MTLRVILQVVPWGEEEKAYEIGRLDIFNMGVREFGHCEYGVIDLPAKGKAGLYSSTVLHRRDLGALELVRKVVDELKIEGP